MAFGDPWGGDEDTVMGDDLLDYASPASPQAPHPGLKGSGLTTRDFTKAAEGTTYGGGIPSSAYSTVMGEDEQGRVTSWFNPQATWRDWFAAPFETIGQFFGADPQFGRHDVFGIPGQTSRDFTRAAAGLYGPQEPWSVEASPLGGILGTVGVRLAPEEGQASVYGYSPWQQGEQTDFTFKDLLPGSGVENKPIYDDENVGQQVGSAQPPVLPDYITSPTYLRSGIGTLSADAWMSDRDVLPPKLPQHKLNYQQNLREGDPSLGVDEYGRPLYLTPEDKRTGNRLLYFRGQEGGPVVKQYQEGGPAMADQGIPMEATGIVEGLVNVQRNGSTEDIVGFVQTHRGDLEYLAQINDPRFDIVRSTLIQFGAPAVPSPSPQGSRLPSERIMEETVSTVPGFSGVADQGFTPGGPISGDVFPPQMQRGGHVGRGTMAGELAPRGSLPVREAGESMYERFKRLHGYDQGGYIGRGTQAGEIMPRGSRSVREEGETMYELAKRREDERNYQGGGPVHHGPSSGVRRLKEAVLSPSMQRRIF